MNRHNILCLSFFSATTLAAGQTPPTTALARPDIIQTSPAAWGTNVNSTNQKLISVTFDQRMSPGYSAWMGRSSLPPAEMNLNPSVSEDRRTLSIKVGLEGGKVYVLGLNEKEIPGVGFQNERGQAALPYFLVFQTAGTPAPDDAPPRVVTTNPVNGAQKVDTVRVKAVSVTFDKAMQVAKHGMHMRENQKEVDLSKARFQYAADGKSFTLAYDFKPASTYEFELNSVHDIGFASAKRVPLWPGKFAFSTQ